MCFDKILSEECNMTIPICQQLKQNREIYSSRDKIEKLTIYTYKLFLLFYSYQKTFSKLLYP